MNCHSIKVRDCYILHTVLLVIILLLIITIICYYNTKQKCINTLTIQKLKIMKLEKFVLKIVHVTISIT